MHQHKLISKLRFLWRSKLHSIPQSRSSLDHKSLTRSTGLQVRAFILLESTEACRKNLRYVSYSIPLLCSIALLGSLFSNSVSAADPSAALTVSNENLSTMVAPGEIGYLSSNVTYSATNTANYVLQVSYANGYDGLRLETESGSGNDIVLPALAASMTGNAMASGNTDAWGYGWSDNTNLSEADFSGLTYSAMPSYGNSNNIKTGTEITDGSGKIIFAAKFSDNNQATGHYKTKVLLSLIATPNILTAYSITYNLNGGTGGPSNYTESLYDTTKVYTIPTTTPTKAGYEFLGWSTDSAATAADANYAPGKSVTLTQDSPSLELYAVWKASAFNGITTMQEMTTAICSAAAVGDTAVLKDTRGGGYTNDSIENSYVIQKLSDGNCWMGQNLKLEFTAVGALTSENSDFTSGKTWPSSSELSDLNDTSSSWTSPHYTKNPASLSGAESYQDKYGYYYNWNAATAGNNDSLSSGQETPTSICPKGWKLPAANKTSTTATGYNYSFNKLITSKSAWYPSGTNGYSNSALGYTNAPGYILSSGFFPAAGRIESGTMKNMGTYGYYWSSIAGSTSGGAISRAVGLEKMAYQLTFHNGTVDASSTSNHKYDLPIRCVAPSN